MGVFEDVVDQGRVEVGDQENGHSFLTVLSLVVLLDLSDSIDTVEDSPN